LSVSARSTQGVLAAEVVLPAASARDQHCAVLTRRRAQPPPRADRNRTVWPLGALERLGELAWLAVAHPPADLGYRQVACRQQLRWRLCAPRIPTRAAMLPSTSDLPAYANGQRFVSKDGERERFSDPDASWGHRSAVSTRKGGGFYGYRVHAAVCSRTDPPLAWRVETAASHESNYVAPLLDAARKHGFEFLTCALDMGSDKKRVYGEYEDRDCRPIIPLRETPAVEAKAGPPSCEHGTWTFAGSDAKHGASKWRCLLASAPPRAGG
jgi:hypothetical protein